jgi:quercetin dioxygenase-like cupin family protein
MRSSEKGKPDLFDKQLSGTANFRVRDFTLDPGSKVPKESSYVDLLL